MQGGAYYLTEEGRWVRNARYPAVPPVRVIPAVEVPELGIRHGRGIYEMVSGKESLLYPNSPKESLLYPNSPGEIPKQLYKV